MATDDGRDLLILGILRRSPMSAYALNRVVRAHVPLYRPFKYGNVYHALERLAARGYLLGRDVEAKRGPRDTKTVYRLSAAGERHFHRLLTAVIADVQTADPTLEIAYVLLGQASAQRGSRVAARTRQAGRRTGATARANRRRRRRPARCRVHRHVPHARAPGLRTPFSRGVGGAAQRSEVEPRLGSG